MKRFLTLFFALCAMFSQGILAQRVLTLDECRRLALQNNKSLAQSRAARDKAMYTRMAAETNYLPKVEAIAGYLHVGREISILNDDQKSKLNNVGTNLVNGIMSPLQTPEAQAILAQKPDLLPLVQQLQGRLGTVAEALNGYGHDITGKFRTDTRNLFGGALLLTQPLYMGGKIRAYDNITHYSERLANLQLSADEQEVILEVDRAYWQVVSLSNKLALAQKFRNTLQKLDDDVQKMIAEGVATRANELQVAVKLNEAEMLVTKVEDGLALSRMLLAQITGADAEPAAELVPAKSVAADSISAESDSVQTVEPAPVVSRTERALALRLADEDMFDIAVDTTLAVGGQEIAFARRPELLQLETAADIYREKAKIERAAYLPQIAFIGGIMVTNPNGYNGFQNKFAGTWSVGVTFKMPVWSWHEGRYKVRAAEAEAAMATYRADEVREKIGLQVSQETFRVNEALKRLRLTQKNLEQADENVRIANVGYQEGVIVLSDVLLAQTAWLQAHSDKIDAQIDVMLTRAALNKALGAGLSAGESDMQEEEEPRSIVPAFMKRIIQ